MKSREAPSLRRVRSLGWYSISFTPEHTEIKETGLLHFSAISVCSAMKMDVPSHIFMPSGEPMTHKNLS